MSLIESKASPVGGVDMGEKPGAIRELEEGPMYVSKRTLLLTRAQGQEGVNFRTDEVDTQNWSRLEDICARSDDDVNPDEVTGYLGGSAALSPPAFL